MIEERLAQAAFWQAIVGTRKARCASCQRRREYRGTTPVVRLEAHHVLAKSWLKQNARGLGYEDRLIEVLWDPRNGLPLCSGPQSCHDRHTAAYRPLTRAIVPESAWEFARELGEPAVARLERDYPVPVAA